MTLSTKYLIEWGIEDNAESTLDLTIGAADLSLQVDTGDGDEFPATINGTATSTGDSNTLNDTGIGASGVAVGDFIRNLTDGSYSVILSVAADTIETLPLWGGSGNTWESGDTWVVNAFVVSVEQYTTQGSPSSGVVKREKIYITQRASGSDIMTVPSGGRGYDGSTAQGFNAGDSVYLFVKDLEYQGLVNGIKNIYDRMNTAETNITTLQTNSLSKDGSIALNNNTTFKARNAANSANVDLFKLTASDVLEFQTLPRNPSSRSISNDYDNIDKKYFTDNSAGTESVTYGETIAVGDPLYFKSSDSKWYKADANDTNKVRARAIAVDSGVADDVKRIRLSGIATGLSGITAGAMHYVSDTGTLSTTPSSTTSIPVGLGLSTTTLLLTWGKKMRTGTGTNQSANGTNDETITLGFRAEEIILCGMAIPTTSNADGAKGTLRYINGVANGGFVYTASASVDSGTITSSISASGSGKTVALTVNSVTDTTFVIRTVNTGTPAGSSSITWVAIGE